MCAWRPDVSERRIILSHDHYDILKKLVDKLRQSGKLQQPHFARLAQELREAQVLDAELIPPDVVSIHSKVTWTALDTDRQGQGILGFPAEARDGTETVSVLSPFGLALIGERNGTTIDYEAPGGTYRIRIDRVEQLQQVS